MRKMPDKRQRRVTKDGLIYKASQQKKTKHVLDEKLKEENMWVHYVLQSLLATFSIFIVLVALINTPVIVAALGSTAFIVFAMPKNITAQPRNVLGGHVVGIISGSACVSMLLLLGNDSDFLLILAASISVGLSIFIMVVTDTEHPPAGSTALGLVIHAATPWDLITYAGFILFSAFIITSVKHVLNPRLRDLV
ncbi:MAG: HPP family protein [Methanomassiliicoccales archaeon]|nr:MAG: HPP family protein [Methanomassiliicoccales archaeon]